MIKVKKLHHNAVLPKRAHQSDAGLDLCALFKDTDPQVLILKPGNRALLPTGLAMEIPYGQVGLIWPRSGLAAKHGIDSLAGLVDSSYRGEIHVALINHGQKDFEIHSGDRIAQLLIQNVDLSELVEVTELDDTDRGAGGFGSSGIA